MGGGKSVMEGLEPEIGSAASSGGGRKRRPGLSDKFYGQIRSFAPSGPSMPVWDVHAKRPHFPNCFGDIGGIESPGKDNGAGREGGDFSADFPVVRLSRRAAMPGFRVVQSVMKALTKRAKLRHAGFEIAGVIASNDETLDDIEGPAEVPSAAPSPGWGPPRAAGLSLPRFSRRRSLPRLLRRDR